MNAIKLFNFENHNIRVVSINNEPWFVLKDVCKVLEIPNVSQVKSRLEDGVINIYPILDSLNRQQQVTVINEDGLYDVILDSRKPEAKSIRKWVTSEVLPSIRKTGGYLSSNIVNQITDPNFLLQWALKYKEVVEEKQSLQIINQQQEQLIEEYQPKISYLETILQSKSLVTITQIAKDYGKSGKAFNELLHSLGIQYKVNNQWVLFSQYQNKGYVSSRTIDIKRSSGQSDIVMLTEWTQKGRKFLYEKLKANNIIPLIEQPQSTENSNNNITYVNGVKGI